jgi:hypothetical protein
VRPTSAGGVNDQVSTQSFTLGLLGDLGALAPATIANVMRQVWLKDHVGEYIVRTTIEKVEGVFAPGAHVRLSSLYPVVTGSGARGTRA